MKIEKGPMETKQQQQKEYSRSRNKFKKGQNNWLRGVVIL